MPMAASDIERLIRARIPDAEVTIRDLAGDGDHYAATVIAELFRGKSRVQQHQIVYEALKAEMGGKLHALALQTGTRIGNQDSAGLIPIVKVTGTRLERDRAASPHWLQYRHEPCGWALRANSATYIPNGIPALANAARRQEGQAQWVSSSSLITRSRPTMSCCS